MEERAVTKLCGYSVCGKRIPEMPKKQYYISTKNNKVYDITDRKVCIYKNLCNVRIQHFFFRIIAVIFAIKLVFT